MADSGLDSLLTARLLTQVNGGAAATLTTPLIVQWLSAVRTADNGADTVVSGVSFSGETFAAATAGAPSTQNSNVAASVSNVPAAFTWAGNRIIDSTAGTATPAGPYTTWWAALVSAGARITKSVNAGDTVTIPSGSFQTSLA